MTPVTAARVKSWSSSLRPTIYSGKQDSNIWIFETKNLSS